MVDAPLFSGLRDGIDQLEMNELTSSELKAYFMLLPNKVN